MANTGKYSGLAIADYFIEKALEQRTPITNMAVLKMVYFAHGLAYKELNEKLVKDPFYAWKFGPVEINIYKTFAKYTWEPITERHRSAETDRELRDVKRNPKYVHFLDTLIPLMRVSPLILSEKSHVPGGPWFKTDQSHKIDDQLIKEYFHE